MSQCLVNGVANRLRPEKKKKTVIKVTVISKLLKTS